MPKFACIYYFREAVLLSMFGHHLTGHKTFRQCHKDLLRLSNDYFIFKNKSDQCMYFISRGEVDAIKNFTASQEVVNHLLIKDEMFGFKLRLHQSTVHWFYVQILHLQRNCCFGKANVDTRPRLPPFLKGIVTVRTGRRARNAEGTFLA